MRTLKFTWWKSDRGALQQAVRDVGTRSVANVRARLRADLSTMSIHEVRGYVRARAMSVVRREARLIADDLGGAAAVSDDLVSQALERTVHLVVRQLSIAPVEPAYRLVA